MQQPLPKLPPSPRAALTPLSIRDLTPFSLSAAQQTPSSVVSSPLSAALSPAPSDCPSISADIHDIVKLENPVIRRAISCSALTGEVKQRRKRSRVSPEQLVQLEEFFAQDTSPTSSRRKEIAQQLGMDERQTQVWFQNRRAKAKLHLKLKTRAVEKLEPPPESPPELANGFDVGIHALIHEDEEVTVFPCTDLTVGSWRRMASHTHDLIAYTCEGKRVLTWFVSSAGRSFKMEIPYEHILESRFANVSPGVGSATFLLERPPTFYMEGLLDHSLGNQSPRVWQVCGDWTERRQGTTHLRHHLVGPAHQLSSLVNSIAPTGSSSSSSSSVALYAPTPPVSDAGSSPEVYSPSLHSPVDQMHPSTLVLRRPSSLSSLRMLHHPSLERLRSRHASTPLFHSPLSSTSSPNSPYAPSSTSSNISPTVLFFDESSGDQRYRGKPDQLTSLPLIMPNLPRYSYEASAISRSASPFECGSEPPTSAVSTPGGCFSGSPSLIPWGGAGSGGVSAGAEIPPLTPAYAPQSVLAEKRPQEPYSSYPLAHSYAFESGRAGC